jgi:hypothetical protein
MTLAVRPLDSQIQFLQLGQELTPVLVIDHLLLDTSWLCQQAQQAAFSGQADNYYPGIRAASPAQYQAAICQALFPLLHNVFAPKASELRILMSAYSIATTATAGLRPIQMLPHFDTVEPMQLAMVHYLCGAEHGGTSFYRHKETGFERITATRLPCYGQLLKQQAKAARLHEKPSYMNGSTPLFERIAQVSAQMNRAVIYPGNLLHSGDIQAALLSADPAQGRLTISSFLNLC